MQRFNLHYYIMIIGGYIADYLKGAKRADKLQFARPLPPDITR